jgi:hypothetical protein
METFFFSLIVIALSIGGLSLGILFGRRPLRGSCGAMACLKNLGGCGGCGTESEEEPV